MCIYTRHRNYFPFEFFSEFLIKYKRNKQKQERLETKTKKKFISRTLSIKLLVLCVFCRLC